MSRFRKLFSAPIPVLASWFSLLSTMGLLLYLAYLGLVDQNPPLRIEPVATFDKTEYHPGEAARLTYRILERRARGPATLLVSWTCDDGTVRVDPPFLSQLSPRTLQAKTVTLVTTIRTDLPIGSVCHSTRTIGFQVNGVAPIRYVTVETTSFLVIPEPEHAR